MSNEATSKLIYSTGSSTFNQRHLTRSAERRPKRLASRSSCPPPFERPNLKLWEKDDDAVAPSSHTVPKIEAHLYYFGIRGPRHMGPKLIYRTSKDVFRPPSGPEQDPRVMQLLPVYNHGKLGRDNLWATICDEVVKLLDQREIKLTSVDLARFRWEEQNADGGTEMVTSLPTIWIGVLPGTLTGDVAFESSQDILQLLEKHDIHDIDIAYRESVARPLVGHE